jgi:hypothetical protein
MSDGQSGTILIHEHAPLTHCVATSEQLWQHRATPRPAQVCRGPSTPPAVFRSRDHGASPPRVWYLFNADDVLPEFLVEVRFHSNIHPSHAFDADIRPCGHLTGGDAAVGDGTCHGGESRPLGGSQSAQAALEALPNDVRHLCRCLGGMMALASAEGHASDSTASHGAEARSAPAPGESSTTVGQGGVAAVLADCPCAELVKAACAMEPQV